MKSTDVLIAAQSLSEAQRADLANRLVVSISDPGCIRQLALIAQNAGLIGSELEREQRLARCREEGM